MRHTNPITRVAPANIDWGGNTFVQLVGYIGLTAYAGVASLFKGFR